MSPAGIAWPIRAILRHQTNARVTLAGIAGIDLNARLVEAGSHRIPYDYLVLATGAVHSYFGHEEWARAAPGLKQIVDATDLRCRPLLAFERAETAASPNECRRLLTFVFLGGGPTGASWPASSPNLPAGRCPRTSEPSIRAKRGSS